MRKDSIRRYHRRFLMLVTLFCLVRTAPVSGQSPDSTASSLADRALASPDEYLVPLYPGPARLNGCMSALVRIDCEAIHSWYLLTAAHCLVGAPEIDSSEYAEAALSARRSGWVILTEQDMAIIEHGHIRELRLSSSVDPQFDEDTKVLPVASADVHIGDTVFRWGVVDDHTAIDTCVVSEVTSPWGYESMAEGTLKIQRGFSGSPVLNQRNEVVGVVTKAVHDPGLIGILKKMLGTPTTKFVFSNVTSELLCEAITSSE